MEHTQGKLSLDNSFKVHITTLSNNIGVHDLIAVCQTGEQGQANAARLVKCWNEHDDRTEQIDDCHKQMRGAIQILKDVADICREYPNQTSSQEILALLTKWSEPKTEQF